MYMMDTRLDKTRVHPDNPVHLVKLCFVAKPGAGVEVNVNGTVKGTVEGDDFAKAFLSIWLGAAPPNPGLKTGLLGGACG